MLQKSGEVIYINADPHSSTASFWNDERSENTELPQIVTMDKFGKSIANDILQLSEKYDTVIVDLGAKDDAADRGVLLVSDVVVIPLVPSAPDVWATTEKTLQTIEECKVVNKELRSVVVINRAPTYRNDMDVKDLEEGLQELLDELDNTIVAKPIIKNRKSYRRAMKNGMGVLELTGRYKDKKAIDEITQLYEEIYQ